jgi:hypothetical protein
MSCLMLALAACAMPAQKEAQSDTESAGGFDVWFLLHASLDEARDNLKPLPCPKNLTGDYKIEQLVFFETDYDFKCISKTEGQLTFRSMDGAPYSVRAFEFAEKPYLQISRASRSSNGPSTWPAQQTFLIVGYQETATGLKIIRVGDAYDTENKAKRIQDQGCIKEALTRQKRNKQHMGFCSYFSLSKSDLPLALRIDPETPVTVMRKLP